VIAPLPPSVAIQEMDPGHSSISFTMIAVNAKQKLKSQIPSMPKKLNSWIPMEECPI